MHRIALIAAFAASLADVAAPLPDTIRDGKAVLARRGSLGADSYVVTNVLDEPPAYVLSNVRDFQLRDRAVNIATVDGSQVAFSMPGRRTNAGYCRAFMLYITVAAQGGCRLSFSGADRILSTDGSTRIDAPSGETMLSFIEIADKVYLVEMRTLSEIINEGNP